MKRKMKRIWKGILTLVLVATMLFGQFPSGLVLVANAEPAGEIGPAIQEITETPPISAGAGSVVDKTTYVMPESASEIVSSEGNSEALTGSDKELDSAPVSENDSSLTDYENSEITSEDDSQIPEKGKSEVADSEEDTSENSEIESDSTGVVEFDAITIITGQALAIKEGILKSLPSLLSVPSEDEGNDLNNNDKGNDTDKEEGEATRGIPMRGTVTDPDNLIDDTQFDISISKVDEVDVKKEYDGNVEVSKEAITIQNWEDLPAGCNYSCSTDDEKVGSKTVTVTITCPEPYHFTNNEQTVTKTVSGFQVVAKPVTLKSVSLSGSRPYKKDDLTIPDAPTYVLDGIVAGDDVSGSGAVYKLKDCNVNTTDTKKEVELVTDNFQLTGTDKGNYTFDPNQVNGALNNYTYSDYSITPLPITITSSGISKESDGNLSVVFDPNEAPSFSAFAEGVALSYLKVQATPTEKWQYDSIIPGKDKTISGYVSADFSLSEDDPNNYLIDVANSNIKGDIELKRVCEGEGERNNWYTDLRKSLTTSDEVKIHLDTNLYLTFATQNYRTKKTNPSEEEKYWFNNDDALLKANVADDGKGFVFYNKNDLTNPIILEMQNKDGSNPTKFEHLVVEHNGIYYGALDDGQSIQIEYNFDNIKPVVPNNNNWYGKYEKQYWLTGNDKLVESGSGIHFAGLTSFADSDEIVWNNTWTQKNNIKVVPPKIAYYYIEDNAGNQTLGPVDGTKKEENRPVIALSATSDTESITEYNSKEYLKNINLHIDVADEEEGESGVKLFEVYLLDGSKGCIEDAPSEYKKDRFPASEEYAEGTKTVSADLSYNENNSGYELYFLVVAVDHDGNRSMQYACWDSNAESKIRVISDISDVYSEYEYDSAVSQAKAAKDIELADTFAIKGNQTVSIQFKDGLVGNKIPAAAATEEDKYYYSADARSVEVAFQNMGISEVQFADSLGTGNNRTFTASYKASSHCYDYSGSNRSWNFPASDDELYKIALTTQSGDLPFGTYAIEEQGEDGTIYLKEERFGVINSKTSITVSYSNTNPVTAHNHTYYNGPVTATIMVSGEMMPTVDEFFNDGYVTVTYHDNNEDVPQYVMEEGATNPWTYNDVLDAFVAKVEYNTDGNCSLQVEAMNLGKTDKNKGKYDEVRFIIDSEKPIFEIGYTGNTNTILLNQDGKQIKYHYYGLENGSGDPSNIEVHINLTEANYFKDDVNIEVVRTNTNGEEIVMTPIEPGKEEEGNNKYSIELVKGSEDQADAGANIAEYKLVIPGLPKGSNDGHIDVNVVYGDPVGHEMVVTEGAEYTVEKEETENVGLYVGRYVSNEREDIIDTVRPVATYSISEYSDGHYDNDGDYYNYAFETKFAVDDKNYANKVGDESYITATYNYQPVKGNAKTDVPLECNETDKTYTYQADDTTEDGSFYFYINGKDLAGNVLKVKKGAGTTSNDHFDEEGVENGIIVLDGADSKYESGKKVLDRTNPTVKLELNTESVKKYIPEGYNRYFFNKDFSGSFTVSDVNPDGKKVNFGIGTNNTAKNYATDSVGAINKVGADYPLEETEQTVKYSFNSDKEGLYAYSIYGCDKAGNKIVLAADATGESKAWHKYIEDETGITTYVIVLDKTAPKTNISMDNFYKAELVNDEGTDKYNVSKNKPYQKKTSAVVLFEEDDKSPASLSYKIVSTVEESSVNRAVSAEKDYVKNFTESVLMDGSQTFNIEELSVTDLAGNIVKMPDPGNKIYLDTTPPNHDNLHPTINFVAKSSGSGRGPAGNPLFTGDVNVEVTITDPGEKKNSSGLYQVYYEIQVKEYDNYKSYTGSCIPSSSTGSAGNGLITYGTDGPDYSNPVSTKNQNLKYSDKLTFAFNAGTFNNNDVKVYVWAKDNAGNEITRGQAASYSFGIDTKAPTISVGYDNNDAQNGKYFKANRTATITVTERNFDESRTSISTQAGAHVSGWSYQRGSSPNGDDDRWVASVVYDTDGDYTLGVSATDIVGHGAGGVDWGNSVAPADFTLDKTMPVINVFFDNNNVQNGRYYNANRRATIDITEHNFDTKDVVVERTASIAEGNVAVPGVGAWTRQADLNRSEVFFGQDGDYTMKVDYVDLAGNPAQTFSIDLFTIDTVAPTLEITGVEDKHAYNGNVAPVITYHDINCDKNSAEVRISGYKHPSGSNLNGVRSDAAFGGSFACDNIERVRENDDVYTAIGSVRDLAGNETSKDVMFSVNRFGSTYILGKETEELVDKYYTNQEETLIVKEINVNELTKTEVSFSKGGEPKDLEKGTGYTVQGVKVDNDGWWEYNYEIGASSFAEDGAYIVNLKSEDAATNANSNNSIKQNDGQNELPIEFFIDKAAPSLTISGVEDGARYRETQRIIGVRFDDNSYVADLKFYVNDQLINQYDAKTLAELDDSLIEYTALSKNNWQNVKVEATDAAGNTNEVKIDRFLITRNFFIQFVNNIPLLIGSIVGVSLLIIGLFLLIFFLRRRKERY